LERFSSRASVFPSFSGLTHQKGKIVLVAPARFADELLASFDPRARGPLPHMWTLLVFLFLDQFFYGEFFQRIVSEAFLRVEDDPDGRRARPVASPDAFPERNSRIPSWAATLAPASPCLSQSSSIS